MTTKKNDAAALTDEQVDGETMFSLLDNGRSVAVRTFAYVLVAVGCLALTSCESPTGPTPVVTADTLRYFPTTVSRYCRYCRSCRSFRCQSKQQKREFHFRRDNFHCELACRMECRR